MPRSRPRLRRRRCGAASAGARRADRRPRRPTTRCTSGAARRPRARPRSSAGVPHRLRVSGRAGYCWPLLRGPASASSVRAAAQRARAGLAPGAHLAAAEPPLLHALSAGLPVAAQALRSRTRVLAARRPDRHSSAEGQAAGQGSAGCAKGRPAGAQAGGGRAAAAARLRAGVPRAARVRRRRACAHVRGRRARAGGARRGRRAARAARQRVGHAQRRRVGPGAAAPALTGARARRPCIAACCARRRAARRSPASSLPADRLCRRAACRASGSGSPGCKARRGLLRPQ